MGSSVAMNAQLARGGSAPWLRAAMAGWALHAPLEDLALLESLEPFARALARAWQRDIAFLCAPSELPAILSVGRIQAGVKGGE